MADDILAGRAADVTVIQVAPVPDMIDVAPSGSARSQFPRIGVTSSRSLSAGTGKQAAEAPAPEQGLSTAALATWPRQKG